jgi:hypothetical protein
MQVARPQKCRVHVEQTADELVLWRRAGSLVVAAFLLVWLTGWTAGCVHLVGVVRREPTLEHLLFAVPFLASWVFVLAVLLGMLLGFERLRVGPDGLEYRNLVGRRFVPLGEVKAVSHDSTVVDTENGRAEYGLRVETLGRPLRFGQGVDPAERLRLAELLVRQLRAFDPDRPVDHRPEVSAKPAVEVEVLRPAGAVPEPPSDCPIRSSADWDGSVFVRRGTFSLTALGAVTFACLFWDGIVGVFVLQLLKNFQWFLFFFLIPFEAVGLALVAGWLAALLAPFRAERWVIGPGELMSRFSVLGMGRTRRVEAAEVGRVELRKNACGLRWHARDAEGNTPYSLGFVSRDGRDLLAIDDLTEGEARWVGGVACEVLKGCLAKDGQPAPPPHDGRDTLWDREIDGAYQPSVAAPRRVLVADIGGVAVASFPDLAAALDDPDTVDRIGRELNGLVDHEGRRRIVLDFEGVPLLLNAQFKGKLVSLHRAVERASGCLHLCNLHSVVRESLRTSRLDGLFRIAPTPWRAT